MHGGKATGAPKGNKNANKHGHYFVHEVARRAAMKYLLRWGYGVYFMHYNFVRLHQTLKSSPAMAAGVTPKLWEMSDLVQVLEEWEASAQ